MKYALIALLLASPLAAQQGPPRQGMDRRAELEGQVMQRFVQRASGELRLDAGARGRLVQIMRDVNAERRVLAQEHAMLRRRMMQSLRDPGTADSVFEALLAEQQQLREREHAIWGREQDRLAEVMGPRQRAQFSLLWMRFQDEIRGVMQRGGPPGGPPGG